MKLSFWSPKLLIPLAGVLFCLGCTGLGAREGDPTTVEYAPDSTVPSQDTSLPDQIGEAVTSIERDLLQEQENFRIKDLDAIQRSYAGPGGKLLISNRSMNAMVDMLSGPGTAGLRITCHKFHFRAPDTTPGNPQQTFEGEVDMLGRGISASGEFSSQVSVHTGYLHALYQYDLGQASETRGPRRIKIERYLMYKKTEEGEWVRVRIDENAPAS